MKDQGNYEFKLKNMGFDENIFEKFFVIRTDKIRKIYSDTAINEVDVSKTLQNKRSRETEDIYEGVDNEYNPYADNSQNENFHVQEEDAVTISDYSEDDEVKEPALNSISPKDGLEIFINCSKKQIDKLNQLVERHQNQTKIFVKAYKSKLKSKNQDIYQKNSKDFIEKIKNKIFHKCNFPGCNRTFASAGWLKSHFNEHDDEILNYKFNKVFDFFVKNIT